jgi:eukaryotic-like serine/threonine-protein kinase
MKTKWWFGVALMGMAAAAMALDKVPPSPKPLNYKHKETFQDCDKCPKMVFLEGGSFQMGSNEYGNEKPVHEVTVENFAIGKYEVTFEEYDYFCEKTGREKPKDKEGWGRGKRPVINVSWNDAVAYTKWLSKETGKEYRLPTEAEWEYAARANSSSKYSFGNDESDLKEYAWYGNNSGDKTHLVGEKKPNGFGLYDMHGNVWEWTCSDYKDNYNGNSHKQCSSNNNAEKSLRGGSWGHDARYCRLAFRYNFAPDYRDNYYGFRVASVSPSRTQ